MDLKDEVAIVTGASRGIGRAIARKLAEEGAKVVVNYNASKKEASGLAEEIKKMGGDVLLVQADVSRADEVKNMVQATIERFGRVDVLVNNAGVHDGRPRFWEEPEEMYVRLFKVNTMGVLLPSQAVAPIMIERRKGKIVHMCSKCALVGEPGHAAYSASKGAVLALTRAMAIELAPFSVNVNAVCPGPVRTDMFVSNLNPLDREKLARVAPLGRIGEPQDIAGIVAYLASEDSDWCTGALIPIDGGFSASDTQSLVFGR